MAQRYVACKYCKVDVLRKFFEREAVCYYCRMKRMREYSNKRNKEQKDKKGGEKNV